MDNLPSRLDRCRGRLCSLPGKGGICRPWTPWDRFVTDSALEGTRFELPVPREIGLAECVGGGAAQPIETAGE